MTNATGPETYLYAGDQRVAEYDATGAMTARYVPGAGEDNPLIWYDGSGTTAPRALQGDERGSIVSVADASGALLAINSYDEYGVPALDRVTKVNLNLGRYQYTGQVWIPQLGLYYYKARFYSPFLGRFLQTDPIGYADQNNLYEYVGNDPMDRADPTGKAASCAAFFKSGGDGSCQQLIEKVRDPKSGAVVTRVKALILSEIPTKEVADKHYKSKDGLPLYIPTSKIISPSEVDWKRLREDKRYLMQLGNNPGALDVSNRRAQTLGSVTVSLAKDGSGGAGVLYDTYNFEMHPVTSITELGRDIGTILFDPGDGKEFEFRPYGYVHEKKK